eukprot:scaffold169_cov103-Isochrysis_galbana.AAC.3
MSPEFLFLVFHPTLHTHTHTHTKTVARSSDGHRRPSLRSRRPTRRVASDRSDPLPSRGRKWRPPLRGDQDDRIHFGFRRGHAWVWNPFIMWPMPRGSAATLISGEDTNTPTPTPTREEGRPTAATVAVAISGVTTAAAWKAACGGGRRP